ncbi:MAG: DUF4294 domain-containing protein [Flavipsychrobacter sp.]|nr:DUF4294 domain-containing protein [Flavipsychrobacter sp.]
MRLRQSYIFPLLITLFSLPLFSAAQDRPILVSAVVEGRDTIPFVYLDEFTLIDKLPKHLAKKQAAFNRLKYNVYKVYPYAVIAADVLKDVDANLARLQNDKKKRKEYLKSVEQELNKRFKGELENLTISQGQVLVKLINRQTGKNCFHIIQELKGGFSAVVWQSVALLFSNSLKKEYDPQGSDREMEMIVAELESDAYYQYKYKMQQGRLQTKPR